jgi:hypothetical protein
VCHSTTNVQQHRRYLCGLPLDGRWRRQYGGAILRRSFGLLVDMNCRFNCFVERGKSDQIERKVPI